MWNLKNNTNEQAQQKRKRVIGTENKQVLARGEGGGGHERKR